MIIVSFKIKIETKNRNEILNAVRNISQEIRKEEGCIDNLISQNLDDENELVMLESWKSMNLLNKHWKMNNFSALLGIQSLLKQKMKIEINKISGKMGLADIEKARAAKRNKSLNKGIIFTNN